MSHSVEKFQNSQWVKLDKINFSKRTILSLVKEGTVLDIGCGDGLLMECLKRENNIKIKGIDISSKAIEICKSRGLDCVQGDITDTLPFADNSFNSVLLIDVLEHIFQPGDVLKEAHRVCTDYVYISVPNFVSFPARLQILLGQVPENNTARDGHVYWMTKKVITDLLNKAGFEVEEIIVNTFWEKVLKYVKNLNQSFFGLSFIIKAKKV